MQDDRIPPAARRCRRKLGSASLVACCVFVLSFASHEKNFVPVNQPQLSSALLQVASTVRVESRELSAALSRFSGHTRLPPKVKFVGALTPSSVGAKPSVPATELPPLLRLSPYRALWQLAWPTILIAVLRTSYGVVDSYWVGLLGVTELEAMGASSFAFWLLVLLGEVASMGVHAVSSVCEGAGKRDGVGEAVVQGLWFSVICAVLALPLMFLTTPYFRLVGLSGNDAVITSGSAYLRGLVWGVAPLTASGVLASGFKGVAKLRPVLIVNVICVLLNFIVDPLLIWGGFGIPAGGVAGAAIATNLCASVATVVSLWLLIAEGIKLNKAWPQWRALAQIIKIGLPMSVGGVLFTCIYIVLGRLLSSMGAFYLAALGLGHKVEALAFTVCEGFGAAAATIIGQWLGANRERDARDAATRASFVAAFGMVPIMVFFLSCARPLISVFTQDPATVAAAVSYLRIVSFCFPFMGVEFVMDGALMAAGDTVPSFVAGLILNGARIPLSLWLAARYGVAGVWAAITLSTIAKAVAKTVAFRRSKLPLVGQCETEP